jgi:hypothetical protein
MQLMDQGVTLRKTDDTLQKVKLRKKFNKREIFMFIYYGALTAFTIWFVTGCELDYFSHIGAIEPLFH